MRSLVAETLALSDSIGDGIYISDISELISELASNEVKYIPIEMNGSKSLYDALK